MPNRKVGEQFSLIARRIVMRALLPCGSRRIALKRRENRRVVAVDNEQGDLRRQTGQSLAKLLEVIGDPVCPPSPEIPSPRRSRLSNPFIKHPRFPTRTDSLALSSAIDFPC
jgi:hypothetical protein